VGSVPAPSGYAYQLIPIIGSSLVIYKLEALPSAKLRPFLPSFRQPLWSTSEAGVITHNHCWGQPVRCGPMHQVPSLCYRVCEWMMCDAGLYPGRECSVFEGPCNVRLQCPAWPYVSLALSFTCTTSDMCQPSSAPPHQPGHHVVRP